MNIQFRNTDGHLTAALQDRIERKLEKLSDAADNSRSLATTTFDLTKEVGAHQNGQVWQATVTIVSGGDRFHASTLADSPEKAVDQVLGEITAEVRKSRGKQRTLMRRGGGAIKSFARRFAGK